MDYIHFNPVKHGLVECAAVRSLGPSGIPEFGVSPLFSGPGKLDRRNQIVYTFFMITWDEPKRLQNLAKHGLDFAEFEIWFDMDSAVVVPGHSDRFKMVGVFRGELLVAAIASNLGTEALALISLRRASKKEHEIYGW